jgi:multidrug transporter EmrE-like cation transporter
LDLEGAGESNESGANTEASTRAGRGSDRGGIDVEDGKDGKGGEGKNTNLLHAQLLAGEEVGGDGNRETLEGILDGTRDQVTDRHSERGGRRRLLRGRIRHLWFIFLCREKMDSVVGNVSLVALSEIFANLHLRWWATGGGATNLIQGLLGYGGVVYFLIRALRLENVLYVNALWDGISAIVQSAAAMVILGDRLKTGQEYVGMIFVFAGVFLLNLGKKN